MLAVGLLVPGCSSPVDSADEDTGSDTDDTDIDTDVDTSVDCESGLKIGQCLPDFTLIGPSGENLTLSSYWGDVVFISSGAMW
jgi:hypothetical protein